jgi:hypothetical protein
MHSLPAYAAGRDERRVKRRPHGRHLRPAPPICAALRMPRSDQRTIAAAIDWIEIPSLAP